MNFPAYFTELLICVSLVLTVRTLGGRWLGPGAKRLLWLIVIVKALVPMTLPTAYHPMRAIETSSSLPKEPGTERSAVPGPVESFENAENPGTARVRFVPGSFEILCTIWLLGFAAVLGVAVGRNRQIVREATRKPVAVPDWVQTIFLDCREKLRLGTWPVLIVSPYVPSPCLVGAVRPRILIPESLTLDHY